MRVQKFYNIEIHLNIYERYKIESLLRAAGSAETQHLYVSRWDPSWYEICTSKMRQEDRQRVTNSRWIIIQVIYMHMFSPMKIDHSSQQFGRTERQWPKSPASMKFTGRSAIAQFAFPMAWHCRGSAKMQWAYLVKSLIINGWILLQGKYARMNKGHFSCLFNFVAGEQ